MALRQKNLRTRRRHVTRSPRHGRSASVRVERLWTCRAGILHPGPQGSTSVEETRRVIGARASSRCQASRWSGMVLGNTWTSVSQTALDV
jgi:hypothetical protein